MRLHEEDTHLGFCPRVYESTTEALLHTLPCVQETITQRHPPRSTSLHCSMEVYNLSCKRSALRWAYVHGWVLQATTGGPVVLIHGPFLQHHCFLQERRNLRLQMRDWHLTRPRQSQTNLSFRYVPVVHLSSSSTSSSFLPCLCLTIRVYSDQEHSPTYQIL